MAAVIAAYLFSLHGSSHGSIPLQLAWQQSWQHRWLTEHHAGPLGAQPFLREADLPTQDPADERLSGDCCCCSTSECTAGRPSTDLHFFALTALSADHHRPALTARSECSCSLGQCLHSVMYSLGCEANWELSNNLASKHRRL